MFPINQFIIFFSKKTVSKVLYDIIAFNVSSIYIGGIGTVWTQKGTKEKPTIFNKISTNFSPKTHTRKINYIKSWYIICWTKMFRYFHINYIKSSYIICCNKMSRYFYINYIKSSYIISCTKMFKYFYCI